MKNPYKRTDVYVCSYSAHSKFKHRVSVYHVEQVKKCNPHGCIMFHWVCARFNKGLRCPRNFKYVGRLCHGCSYFQDEKINHQPRVKLSPFEYEIFRQELEQFDDWLDEHRNREVELTATINSVKPCFKKSIAGKSGQVRLDGYLLTFNGGFIGTTEFDDYFYARVTPRQQERFRFCRGDRFDAKGKMVLDRGRLLFPKIWAIEVTMKNEDEIWENSEALVAKQTATLFTNQNENCLRCRHGALVDVTEKIRGEEKNYRELYCLKSISDPSLCYIHTKRQIDNCM